MGKNWCKLVSSLTRPKFNPPYNCPWSTLPHHQKGTGSEKALSAPKTFSPLYCMIPSPLPLFPSHLFFFCFISSSSHDPVTPPQNPSLTLFLWLSIFSQSPLSQLCPRVSTTPPQLAASYTTSIGFLPPSLSITPILSLFAQPWLSRVWHVFCSLI